jgi:hypothetical protein
MPPWSGTSHRTTFRNESGVPVQVIEDEPAARGPQVRSVEDLPADERRPAALALIRDLAGKPFDLATGPLVGATVVRLAPDAHVLAVVMHHIVADGWSFRILFDELSADYEAITAAANRTTRSRRSSTPLRYVAAQAGPRTARRAPNGSWRTELGDATPTLALPVRPVVPGPADVRGREHGTPRSTLA